MTMRKLLYAIVVLAIVGIAVAQPITIEPSDDMYSDPDHTGAHPTDELWVANYDPAGNHQRIMMKFDLDDYIGQEIDSAILNLNRFFGCPSGEPTHTNFYDITATWDESSWPENTHISHGTAVWANYVFNANGWHRIDITPLVQEWLDGTTPNYGFVIEAIPGNKFSKFYSKEAASGVRPYLELFGATDVDEKTATPENFAIQIYPNPFNSSCAIIAPAEAKVEILDMMGNVVASIFDVEPATPILPGGTNERSTYGEYRRILWTPDEPIQSGIYFIRATIPQRTVSSVCTKKVVYLK
ncbi:DNRLRE domain-containing protein [bacterium]|nr:DNRLRE domain-containing protein [bacterium]